MRFMIMHKVTDEMEKGLPPEPAVMEGIGKLMEDGLKQKVFLGGEGLKPTSQRRRIAYERGKRTVVRGPFEDDGELPAGFALIRVRSEEEAIAWWKGGKRTVIDGPFAESKELVAGYAIFELPSKADAIAWAIRFGETVRVAEVDVRLMQEP
jgi:hypothetical protein